MNIKIYQIKEKDDLIMKFLFTSIDRLKNGIKDVDINNYDIVYEFEYHNELTETNEILEDIFRIFNIARPTVFYGHSLSVSDIIELDGEKYFCNDFGFVKL